MYTRKHFVHRYLLEIGTRFSNGYAVIVMENRKIFLWTLYHVPQYKKEHSKRTLS